jgi:hypothetical protein
MRTSYRITSKIWVEYNPNLEKICAFNICISVVILDFNAILHVTARLIALYWQFSQLVLFILQGH